MNQDPTDTTLNPITPDEQRLERYLDGLMSPDEKAAFEAESAALPAVAAQIAAHRRLASVLGQMYDSTGHPATADAETALPAPLPMTPRAGATPHSPRRLVRLAAIAAAVALPVAAAVWFMVPGEETHVLKPMTTAEYQKKNLDAMTAEYKAQVASGFKPKEICTTDEQFAQWTTQTFGRPLKPVHPAAGSGAPPEPQLAGWSKATIFSSYTGILLAHVDGQPVMVVMDNAPADRMVPLEDAASTPRIFRRKVNEVWLIEVTPLDKPRVITNIEPG